jgi:hypothetical protein
MSMIGDELTSAAPNEQNGAKNGCVAKKRLQARWTRDRLVIVS